MNSVVLIGAGNLGRRHLQGLKASKNDMNIVVVDSFPQSLILARSSYEEIKLSAEGKSVRYVESIDEYDGKIDVAIVATTAMGRLDILESLVKRGARNIVLEKIAFNSVLDIREARKLFSEGMFNGWVNCPRRMNDSYVQLAKELKTQIILEFHVKGRNYGMACNAIHFIDLFSFLSEMKKYEIDLGGVRSIVESKRSDCVEFIGRIDGKFDDGPSFYLECESDSSDVNFVVEIVTNKKRYSINEVAQVVEVRCVQTEKLESNSFRQPYQSELTGTLVDEVLSAENCGLTDFGQSMELHEPFIEEAYRLYVDSYGENSRKMVPIT